MNLNDKNEILERFGSMIIKEVYDRSVKEFRDLTAGHVNAPSLINLHNQFLKNINIKNMEVFNEFGQECLISILHNFFWMIEQSDEFDLVARTDNETVSLKEISDGLYGEAYGENGWIAKYSKYKNVLD